MTSEKQGEGERFSTRPIHSGISRTTAAFDAPGRGVFGGVRCRIEADDARGAECDRAIAD